MPKIVIANFYPVWPIKGGGQRRIFFLARELSRAFEVEIIAPVYDRQGSMTRFSDTLVETRIPVERTYASLAASLQKIVPLTSDLAYTKYWQSCRLYQSELQRVARDADALVTAHPYSIYALLDARGSRSTPIVFDSQNVEVTQKKSVLSGHPHFLDEIRAVEQKAIAEAALIIACSQADAQQFHALYGLEASRVELVENGVDALAVPLMSEDVRDRVRAEVGLQNRFAALFAGSYHHPNLQAVDHILRWAAQNTSIVFMFLGSICDYKPLKESPLGNVVRLGQVDETVKWVAFQIADIGLNPMELGSGTNVKMFEYAAARVPVLTTPFGARGIPLKDGRECIIRPIEDFFQELCVQETGDESARKALAERARTKIIETSDWTVIGEKYQDCFTRLIGSSRRNHEQSTKAPFL